MTNFTKPNYQFLATKYDALEASEIRRVFELVDQHLKAKATQLETFKYIEDVLIKFRKSTTAQLQARALMHDYWASLNGQTVRKAANCVITLTAGQQLQLVRTIVKSDIGCSLPDHIPSLLDDLIDTGLFGIRTGEQLLELAIACKDSEG